MSTILNTEETYRIETKTSAGKIEDPVTGEQHEIESYESKRGGTVEVSRPDSAHYIEQASSRRSFVEKAPTTQQVRDAERENFDFAGSEVCEAFAAKTGDMLGDQNLGKSNGFDPLNGDGPINDPELRVTKMHGALQSAGYDDEAGYLRALPSVDKQEEFCSYVRSHEGISL